MRFGPRWAYHWQGEILAERLDEAVFPSKAAFERNLNQILPMVQARYDAERIIECRKECDS
jgi:hypothetical protein